MAFELDGSGEFLVNFEADGAQKDPVTAGLPGGRSVMVWATDDTTQDNDETAIKARIFDAEGNPVVAEFLVNTAFDDDQAGPSIGIFADGRFVVTWTTEDPSQDGDSDAIKGQVFNANGTPSGGEFLVNQAVTAGQSESAVTVLVDGRFVVTWLTKDANQDGNQEAIKARLFNGDGTPAGDEFLVNTTGTVEDQRDPAVAAAADGGFLIVWKTEDPLQDGDGEAIKARLFDADGAAAASEFVVNNETAGSQRVPQVAALSEGRFVVTWQTNDATQDGSSHAIKARILDADGSVAGDEFLVNGAVAGLQGRPTVTGLADGRFAVAWETGDPLQDGDNSALKMRVFEADGTGATEEILVHEEFPGQQLVPFIATLADGRIAATWQTNDATQDGSSRAIKARIFELVNKETGTGANEVFIGESVRDAFEGMGGKDLLFGKQGDDNLDGGKGKDQAFGGAGDDTVLGGKGKDDLSGGKGDDSIFGEKGDDTLNGNRGNDTLDGGDGDDLLLGGDDDDILTGGDGKDKLKGQDGDDVLHGGKGKDKLIGGKDDDIVTGGKGKDKFVFKPDGSVDIVTDFQNNKDKLDLSAFGFGSKAKALKKFSESGTASDDQIAFAHNGTAVEINGIDMGQLGGGDLII